MRKRDKQRLRRAIKRVTARRRQTDDYPATVRILGEDWSIEWDDKRGAHVDANRRLLRLPKKSPRAMLMRFAAMAAELAVMEKIPHAYMLMMTDDDTHKALDAAYDELSISELQGRLPLFGETRKQFALLAKLWDCCIYNAPSLRSVDTILPIRISKTLAVLALQLSDFHDSMYGDLAAMQAMAIQSEVERAAPGLIAPAK